MHDVVELFAELSNPYDTPVGVRVAGALVGSIERLSKIRRNIRKTENSTLPKTAKATFCSCCSLPKLLCQNSSGLIDVEAARYWLRDCESNHDTCNRVSSLDYKNGTSMYPSILIDVLRECLVPINSAERYCTLSYVYGGFNSFTTRRHNFALLQVPGSLRTAEYSLPQVVVDAMTLTAAIGERYLWVDSLCIVHDGGEEFTDQINHMNVIYGQAVLTFAVISGTNASIPIPGVQTTSRRPLPSVSLWDEEVVFKPPSMEFQLEESAYASRAWVFQEQLLSLRCLFITRNEVYFLCRERHHRELLWSLKASDGSSHSKSNDRSSSATFQHLNPLDAGWSSGSIPWPARYFTLVRQYSQKTLTKDGDILRAFAGIEAVLARAMSTTFTAGLPLRDLSLALHWIPRCATKVDRQSDLDPSGTDRERRRRGFPSFSWAGWYGPVAWLDVVTDPDHWRYSSFIDFDAATRFSQGRWTIPRCVLARLDGLTFRTSKQTVVFKGIDEEDQYHNLGYELPLHKIFDSLGRWCGMLCSRSLPAEISSDVSPLRRELRFVLLSQCVPRFICVAAPNEPEDYVLPFDETVFAQYWRRREVAEARLYTVLLVAPALHADGSSIAETYERVALCQIHKSVWDVFEKNESEVHIV